MHSIGPRDVLSKPRQAEDDHHFSAVIDCLNMSETLFDNCTPGTLSKIAQTCRVAQLATAGYCRRNFDIDKHLAAFFPNVFLFRVLQAKTNCVISGSNALQFLARTKFSASDLDLFVASIHAQEVCDWLLNDSGVPYRFQPSAVQEERGLVSPEGVIVTIPGIDTSRAVEGPYFVDMDFSKTYNNIQVLNFVDMSDTNRKIQVIVTQGSPIDCILSFHSSVVMNLITYKAAYSIFPTATFEDHVNIQLGEINRDCETAAIHKYVQRGWPLAQNGQHSLQQDKRRIGDPQTWTVTLKDVAQVVNKAGLQICRTDLDPATLNTFNIVTTPGSLCPEIDFYVLKPRLFVNHYTACAQLAIKARILFDILAEYVVNSDDFKDRDGVLVTWNDLIFQKCVCGTMNYEGSRCSCPAFLSIFKSITSIEVHVE